MIGRQNMTIDRDLLDELSRAETAGHLALTRHLCELILADEPDDGPTLIRYASCLLGLSLYDTAAKTLDRAEMVVPLERRQLVLAQRGHLRQAMGDYVGAERCFLSAHNLDPDDATYLIYSGSVAFARGDIKRAEEFVRLALECSEGSLDEAYFNLGGYLVAQSKYEEARTCYLRALEIDPDYEIAKKRLADLDRLYERRQSG